MTITLIANRPMRYGTRRLLAGDTFECERRHVKALIATKRCTAYDRPLTNIPPIPEQVKAKVAPIASGEQDATTALRAEYQAKFGKRAYHGWDAEELRRRISDTAPETE